MLHTVNARHWAALLRLQPLPALLAASELLSNVASSQYQQASSLTTSTSLQAVAQYNKTSGPYQQSINERPANRKLGRAMKLVDYHNLMLEVVKRNKPYLLRDIVEEMRLNGISPERSTWMLLMLYSLRSKSLLDGMYAFNEMKRRGMEFQAKDYASVLAALGRMKQTDLVLQIRQEGAALEFEKDANYKLQLLQALGDCGLYVEAQEVLLNMFKEKLYPPPAAFAYLITAYMNAPQTPPDFAFAVLDLAERSKMVTPQDPSLQGDNRVGTSGVSLAVYNAALAALHSRGLHELVERLRRRISSDGLTFTAHTYVPLILSYLQDAKGHSKAPSSIPAQLQAFGSPSEQGPSEVPGAGPAGGVPEEGASDGAAEGPPSEPSASGQADDAEAGAHDESPGAQGRDAEGGAAGDGAARPSHADMQRPWLSALRLFGACYWRTVSTEYRPHVRS